MAKTLWVPGEVGQFWPDLVKTRWVPQRLVALVGVAAMLVCPIAGCCDGEGQGVVTLSCQGECLGNRPAAFRVEFEFGDSLVICEDGNCEGDVEANSLWLEGRLQEVYAPAAAGQPTVRVRVFENDELTLDAEVELSPRPVYCGCNENTGVDPNCGDARLSHTDWYGLAEYDAEP